MQTTEVVNLYGAAWSVYVRIARLALEEKQINYRLVEVDVFAENGVPQEHLKRHPFGRIPTFEHGDFHLYETGAIVRYIDDAFPGCRLQPTDIDLLVATLRHPRQHVPDKPVSSCARRATARS
ncbi:glutathione S-transferase N-terminal domain-containing protein [Paraburkholderia nemoris]|uniref:glutathione S-transferase N-terminal domain-containing protein n=1 Tax=Paraburkholderia nemoris TaxID=2793076 RepID=UPI001F2D77F1|nr:glutathione S-transferase N-terminal domain-containing protein [Paraburkholderia nemoris]